MGHYPQPGSSYERGPFIFQSILVSLIVLAMLVSLGFKIGAAVVAHVECSQVTKGQVLRSNMNNELYCHVYER